MSAIQQMLIAGKGITNVSGSVTGGGSLTIPAGVTSISFTGQGGAGAADTYNPGQPQIDGYRYISASFLETNASGTDFISPKTIYPIPAPSTTSTVGTWSNNAENILTNSGPVAGGSWTIVSASTASVRFGSNIDSFYYVTYSVNSEWAILQNYIAPTGSPASVGAATTATFQSTVTWAGSSTGVTTFPTAYAQILTGLSGAGGALSYSVAPGTTLYYSYSY